MKFRLHQFRRKFLEENNFKLHEGEYVKYYVGAPSSEEDSHGGV